MLTVSVDGVDLYTVTDLQEQVLRNDIPTELLAADLRRRLEWVLMHKHAQCMARLRKEWMPLLAANGVTEVPVDDDAFAALVFEQPNYLDRSARDALSAADDAAAAASE